MSIAVEKTASFHNPYAVGGNKGLSLRGNTAPGMFEGVWSRPCHGEPTDLLLGDRWLSVFFSRPMTTGALPRVLNGELLP